MRIAVGLAVLALAGCASAGGSGGWTRDSWAAQAVKEVTSGPYSFSASPYGEDGFKINLKIRMNAVRSSGMGPDEEQFMEAARAAAPEGCKVKSVTRQPDGSAVADYDCG